MKNEYGITLDRNGYAPSIIQHDTSRCFLCGGCCGKLDRHEPFGGGLRQKSKRIGMWVVLCHDKCHLYGPASAHGDKNTGDHLKRRAQFAAMRIYGWDTNNFIREFGKNYLGDAE